MSFDALSDAFTFEADHVVSNWSIIYASSDTLLLAEPADDWWWYWNNDEFEEETNIHRFDSTATGSLLYSGSGRVRGTVLSQFSLSQSMRASSGWLQPQISGIAGGSLTPLRRKTTCIPLTEILP